MEDTPILIAVFLPVALAIIMFTLGLSLTPADFKRIFVQPRGVAIGLANLLVISPLLAFAVAELYDLDPLLAVGLVLLGASPGGTLANLMTHVARGDTALSVTMTGISSIAATITVPLYLGLAIDHFGADLDNDPEMLGVALRVFFITVVPLSIGMWLRSRSPERVRALEPNLKRAALGIFLLVVIAATADEFEIIRENFTELALATLTLNLLAMGVSFTVARVAGLDDFQSTAIAMELGIHNSTVAITVGASITEELAIPGAVYSVFMFITAGLFARLMWHRNGRRARTSEAPA